MPSLRLRRSETDAESLPMVCMSCGQPAVTHIRKTFSWVTEAVPLLILVGLLPYLIVYLIMLKRMRVHAPMCRKHRHYWLARILWMLLPFLALIGLVIVAVIIAMQIPAHQADEWAPFVFFGWIVALVLWIIVAAVIHFRSIRPTEITDRSITLIRLHQGFVDAFYDQFEDEPEDRPRRPARRDRDQDYEDDGYDD